MVAVVFDFMEGERHPLYFRRSNGWDNRMAHGVPMWMSGRGVVNDNESGYDRLPHSDCPTYGPSGLRLGTPLLLTYMHKSFWLQNIPANHAVIRRSPNVAARRAHKPHGVAVRPNKLRANIDSGRLYVGDVWQPVLGGNRETAKRGCAFVSARRRWRVHKNNVLNGSFITVECRHRPVSESADVVH